MGLKSTRHLPVGIGRGGYLLTGEFDGHFFACVRRAPDRHLHVALQDHVAGERAGETHLRPGARRERDGAEGQDCGKMPDGNRFVHRVVSGFMPFFLRVSNQDGSNVFWFQKTLCLGVLAV